MSKTDELRRLIAEATPGPWHEVSAFAAHDTVYPSINGDYITTLDSKLICFLRNNAALFLELLEAAEGCMGTISFRSLDARLYELKAVLDKFEGGGG